MNIYTPEIMRQYAGRPRHELEPHIFAVAEEAYRRMIIQGKNQSIIVSGNNDWTLALFTRDAHMLGESGAGKTQSARYVMQYFALVDELSGKKDKISGPEDGSTSIEDAVLSTNPIMEVAL
jgi:myosin-5